MLPSPASLLTVIAPACLVLAGVACAGNNDDPEPTPTGSEWDAAAVNGYPYPVEMFPNEAPRASARHFAEGELEGYNAHDYGTEPPTSGKHLAELATPGVYDAVPVPNEVAVHNMEHGFVIVWYNCNADLMLAPADCAEFGNSLAAIVQPLVSSNHNIVLTPHLTMEPRIALTAWQFMDVMDAVDKDRITAFIETFECHYDPEETCG